MDLIHLALRVSLVTLLTPVVVGILLSLRKASANNALICLLGVILLSMAIPLRPFSVNGPFYSIIDYITLRDNYFFVGMFLSYLLSFVLLVFPGFKFHKLALYFYIAGVVFTLLGIVNKDFGMMVYSPYTSPGMVYLLSYIWLLLYIVFPLGAGALFAPLIKPQKNSL
jgi:hypothetical protein